MADTLHYQRRALGLRRPGFSGGRGATDRHGGLGHQPGGQPGARRDLLGHGHGRDGGAISGVPAIAVSMDSYRETDFTSAAHVAARLVEKMVDNGLHAQTLPSVNVPATPAEEIAGVMVTRMGLRIYHDELVRRIDPRGRPYYWIGGDEPGGVLEEGTDLWVVTNNYVSVTPIQLDLTHHDMIDHLQSWDLDGALTQRE